MDYSNEIPSNCSIIKEKRLTLLIRNDYKEKLLKQGLMDPQRLIATASKAGTTYKGRGLLPTVPIKEGGSKRSLGFWR